MDDQLRFVDVKRRSGTVTFLVIVCLSWHWPMDFEMLLMLQLIPSNKINRWHHLVVDIKNVHFITECFLNKGNPMKMNNARVHVSDILLLGLNRNLMVFSSRLRSFLRAFLSSVGVMSESSSGGSILVTKAPRSVDGRPEAVVMV